MRNLLAGLLLLAFSTSGSIAQRPWIRSATPDVGTPPRLVVAANSLIAFDLRMASSANQGENWALQTVIPDHVRGVTDFFSNVSICASQAAKGDSVDVYFTQGGTSWSFSERLDVGDREVVEIEALDQTFYVVNNGGTILARSIKITELVVPIQNGSSLIDLEVSADLFGVLTSEGVFVSKDKGSSWTKNNPVPEGSSPTCFNLIFRSGKLIASTTNGVMRFNADSSRWDTIGHWPDSVGVPTVRAVAADGQRIIAFAETPAGRLQLYRLETGDTSWIVTGYEFPMDQPQSGRDMLEIDAGWAVTYQSSAADPDSTGMYRYNLNDFTSVKEELLSSNVRIQPTTNGLLIDHPFGAGGWVELIDLTGRRLVHVPLGEAPFHLALAESVRGTMGVVVSGSDGRTARTIILR